MSKDPHENKGKVVLKRDFRKLLFSRILEKIEFKLLTKKFGISHQALYRYKNEENAAIPLHLAKWCARKTGIINRFDKNISKFYKPGELRRGCLSIGRTARKLQLNKWRHQIPKVSSIVSNGSLDLEKWFERYLKLINFGARNIKNISYDGNKIVLNYDNFAKGESRDFTSVLPRKIPIDKDFQYFFGLWCGDRVGGGRIGVVNKAEELNRYTTIYLKNKLYQEPKFVLLKSSRIRWLPKLNFRIDAVQEVKGMPGDWVLCVWSVNGILKSFFDYLDENLENILDILPNKNIFFAGLFDAEGNVFLEDKCFRWACKEPRKVEVYKKYLSKLGLFYRYDGGNLITNNKERFYEVIFPYIKQKDKINKSRLACTGKGHLDKRFRSFLSLINKNPGKTASELARIIKMKKLYAQIKVLENFKYIARTGYPRRAYIIDKGLKELRREG